MGQLVQFRVGNGGGVVLGVQDLGGQARHDALAVSILIAYSLAGSVRYGGQEVAVVRIGGAGFQVRAGAAAERGRRGISNFIILVLLGHHTVGNRGSAMGMGGIFVFISKGSIAAGDAFDQIPVFVLAPLSFEPCCCNGSQIPVIIVLHDLGRFLHQGEIVKIRNIGISFVGADNLYLLDRLIGPSGNYRHRRKLPGTDVRTEGRIVVLCCAIGIGQDYPQAKLLILIPCGSVFHILEVARCNVVRDGVRLAPAGEHICLGAGLV